MHNEMLTSPASAGSVAFNLMVEQASVPAEVIMPKAAMLLATQLLLDLNADGSADRYRITGGRPGVHAGADVYTAVLGRSTKAVTLLVPSIYRFYKSSILSVLRATAAATCQIQMNGMAGKGTHQLMRWGDSGDCELRWPRSMVESYLATPRFDSMSDQAKGNTASTYGPAPTLVVYGEHLVLPPLQQCEKVWRALHGEQVVVTDAELDLIEPVLCAGLRLVSAPNPMRVGIRDAYILQLPPDRTH